ncbi:MAG: hypothetical protein MUE41_06665 [Gemmatimonadaceae bacterium]|jgi:hypothetical protein|nr:hypothetical protein [Gemmatimonadaceae bacterium]
MIDLPAEQDAARIARAQQEAANAMREAQQRANDARELANRLREQAQSGGPEQPPSPPVPPGAPRPSPNDAVADPAVVGAEGGSPIKIVVNGKTFLLDRASGGDAITLEAARQEFGNSEDAQLLDRVLPIVGIIFGCVTVWVVFDSMMKFFTKRAERRQALELAKHQHASQGERFDRLESAIEAMAVEVERITEAQRFQTRLLTERAASLPQPSLQPTSVVESPVAVSR